MSKVFKKAKKFVSKSIKAFDPGMDALLGISKGEEMQKQAREQADIARQQAQQQQAQAAESARASAMQMRTDADRQRILAEQGQSPSDTSAPEVVGSDSESAAERRRKFREPQVGGTGGGGPSIRL